MNNDFESAINTFLISRSEITSLVGQNIFPEEAFQGAVYPTITYSLINEVESRTLLGDSTLCWAWFEFCIYSTTSTTRRATQDVLRNLFSGKINSLLTYTGGSVILSTAWLMASGKDFYQSPQDGSDSGIFERKMTFRMCFHQSIPTL